MFPFLVLPPSLFFSEEKALENCNNQKKNLDRFPALLPKKEVIQELKELLLYM